ncbi:MAG: hypothetical protein IT376_08960 [Polyangiaceae bacterium]|nr:hypothetical protein [Polyangiaceae bacterium]
MSVRRPTRPLQALARAREAAVQEKTRALGAAVAARDAAAVSEGAAHRSAGAEAERAAAVRAGESARIAQGVVRGADLETLATWEVGARERARADGERVAAARRATQAADSAVAGARGEVAHAEADREVIARHLQRREQAERARREDEVETEVEALWLHRRGAGTRA